MKQCSYISVLLFSSLLSSNIFISKKSNKAKNRNREEWHWKWSTNKTEWINFECQYPTLFFNVINSPQKLSLAFVQHPLTFIFLLPISQCFFFHLGWCDFIKSKYVRSYLNVNVIYLLVFFVITLFLFVILRRVNFFV